MNNFSNTPAETPLRDEITVRSDEFDPVANPAYDGPMGIMTDYDGCDSDVEEKDPEPDDSMDGDFDSGMASAGFGTSEDYGDYGGNDEY